MSFKIQLPIFEGPLDLLLFFIKRDEVDIYDIPIARITKDYMDYLNTMQSLNIQLAGEFITLAATLLKIKARMLLPGPATEEEQVEDPRLDLTRMLLEYQRFKDAGQELKRLEELNQDYFPHPPAFPEEWLDSNPAEVLQDITLYQLIESLKQVIESMPRPTYYELEKLHITLQEQTEYILEKLQQREQMKFSELVREFNNRIRIIITFLACLDLAHKQKIHFVQRRAFRDFTIKLIPSH